MALRDSIRRWLGVDGRIRDLIREELTRRAPESGPDETEARLAALEKKLKMTMGSVQASSMQVMALDSALEGIKTQAAQATQQSTTAKATAEATADGLEGVEEQLAALMVKLAKPAKRTPRKKS